ncbi:hypothetical protein X766_15755 [Mesorhizobium sp. LSJC255A00]|uniref:hypothetical protein n=1 Tax=Mesorhizobium sp. LSJC255A00 TaxID=1287313 RepID=UPI0003CEDB30|nr:hypothetical protein [Mesorhizobium sp. LSJC255A00]ESX17861.1 hypothetical protein X766_15755 [Mesorhizobium sp. LSJC255A00]
MAGDNRLFNTVTALLNILFEKEEAQITKRTNKMIAKNISLGGSGDGFRHMGEVYSELSGVGRRRGNYSMLNQRLVGEMDAILAERKAFRNERDRIRQAFTMVLRDCRTFQDMRDALPNCVKDLIPECRHLERTRPEAFTLADNPRSYTQYMQLREKIEFYVASRLLY